MIRRIVVSLVPLLVAAPLMAQAMVGVRAGLSRATVSPAVEGEGLQDGRQGVVAGLDIAFPLASTVELRIGGAYSQKGTSYFRGARVGRLRRHRGTMGRNRPISASRRAPVWKWRFPTVCGWVSM